MNKEKTINLADVPKRHVDYRSVTWYMVKT